MIVYIILGISIMLNIGLTWYLSRVLAKLLYTSDNLGDLYVLFRMFEDFTGNLYSMDVFHGEPVLQELVERIKIVREELERFEEIYELTTDVGLIEEELADDNKADQEAYKADQEA